MPPERCVDSLVLNFTNVPVTIRGSAVAEVYLVGEARAAARLFELLDHPRMNVRAGATNLCAVFSEASETVSPPPARFDRDAWSTGRHWLQHVTAALRHPNTGVRLAAVGALARLRPKRASELLIGAAEDETGDMRIAALTALGALGGSASAATLTRFLNEGTVDSRIGAARGLAQLGSSDETVDCSAVLTALHKRLVAARRTEASAPEVNAAPPLSEVAELERAIRKIAEAAGLDLSAMFPLATLPIPSIAQVPDCRSLPVCDGEA